MNQVNTHNDCAIITAHKHNELLLLLLLLLRAEKVLCRSASRSVSTALRLHATPQLVNVVLLPTLVTTMIHSEPDMRRHPDPQHLWCQSFCSCPSQAMKQFTATSQAC